MNTIALPVSLRSAATARLEPRRPSVLCAGSQQPPPARMRLLLDVSTPSRRSRSIGGRSLQAKAEALDALHAPADFRRERPTGLDRRRFVRLVDAAESLTH